MLVDKNKRDDGMHPSYSRLDELAFKPHIPVKGITHSDGRVLRLFHKAAFTNNASLREKCLRQYLNASHVSTLRTVLHFVISQSMKATK
uniref:Transposase n=1 Tax=Syphacia muris TaxID=451379 RepID=A0A0N5A9T9_9BILA